MSQFSRRARWLNFLFPASVQPTTRDPAQRSDDVSLVQPYDGGGWPLVPQENWFYEVQSPVAAATQWILHTVAADSIFRILACGVQRIAGAVYTRAYVQVRLPNTTFNVQISDIIPLVDGNELGFSQLVCPVIPAGSQILLFVSGGDVLSQATGTLIGVEAPVGTVFYV